MLILLAAPAAALGTATVSFTTLDLEGSQRMSAEQAGLRLQSVGPIDGARLQAGGKSLQLTTVNYTTYGAITAGTQPDRDGGTRTLSEFTLAGDGAAGGVDVLILPIAGASETASVIASTGQARLSPDAVLAENPRVDSTRPVYSTSVASKARLDTSAASSVRIEGSFVVSIWSWNFTASSPSGSDRVVTGSWRSPVVATPLLGQTVAYQEFAQVAQLEIRDGWLELESVFGGALSTYADRVDIEGTGTAVAAGSRLLEGDQNKLPLDNSALDLAGDYKLRVGGGPTSTLEIRSLVGSVQVDGVGVNLGNSGPLRSSTVQRDNANNPWAWPLGVVGLLAFAVLVQGPALTGQFNRIQLRFERKDYVGVLGRIDRFTRRPKFARRASFLKAVSLLSIGDYQEAALYLQSLAPHDAPDPATRAFLQACAAAGLGQESTAIERLQSCFKLDPSYIEEARTVPVLTGYLAYFSLADDGEAA